MKKFSILFAVLILNIYLFSDLAKSYNQNDLVITFLDIGQGDAILIKTPNDSYGLVDAGKGNTVLFEIYKFIPMTENTLDFIVLTHPDLDHIEGFIEILKRFTVEQVFVTKSSKSSEAMDEIESILLEKAIPTFELNYLNDFELDNVSFDIVWPQLNIVEESNDNSIGILINHKNFNLYSAGDLSSEYENSSIKNFESLDVDVLKAGHHGSKTSTDIEFLEKTMPEVTVISAGKNNSYGHPHVEVLENLRKIDSKIYRTDEAGNISLITNGEYLKIKTDLKKDEISIKI